MQISTDPDDGEKQTDRHKDDATGPAFQSRHNPPEPPGVLAHASTAAERNNSTTLTACQATLASSKLNPVQNNTVTPR